MTRAGRAVLVAGMHRSGTSAYTRVLNLLGADLGPPERMVRAKHDNPEGFWEHWDLVRVNRDILNLFGQGWEQTEWLPDDWQQRKDLTEYRRRIHQVLDRDFSESELWAFKDPRLCLTLPFWRQVLTERDTECTILIPVRHPLEVAGSLAKRDELPIERGLGFWLKYNLNLAEAALGLKGLIVGYDRLMSRPAETIDQLAAFLETPPDAGAMAAANASLRPQLQHNVAAPDEAMPKLVRDLWELLKSREGGMLEPADREGLAAIRAELFSKPDRAVTRDLSWMAEFEPAKGDAEVAVRRVAVSLDAPMLSGEKGAICPARAPGIACLRNPVWLWNGPGGLRQQPAKVADTKEALVLDEFRGFFLIQGWRAEISYSLPGPEPDSRLLRLAFDFSFFPMPLHYIRFVSSNRKVWRLIEFLRKIRRWCKRNKIGMRK